MTRLNMSFTLQNLMVVLGEVFSVIIFGMSHGVIVAPNHPRNARLKNFLLTNRKCVREADVSRHDEGLILGIT